MPPPKTKAQLDQWNQLRVDDVDRGMAPEIFGMVIHLIDKQFWRKGKPLSIVSEGGGMPKAPPPGYELHEVRLRYVILTRTGLHYKRVEVYLIDPAAKPIQ